MPGKLLYAADELSRAPSKSTDEQSRELEEEVEVHVVAVVASLPAIPERLSQYKEAQQRDRVCSRLAQYCKTSWPAKQTVRTDIVLYWKVRDSLTIICDGLLLYDD